MKDFGYWLGMAVTWGSVIATIIGFGISLVAAIAEAFGIRSSNRIMRDVLRAQQGKNPPH